MNFKTRLDSICNSNAQNDREIASKLAEIRGLYTAYEVAPNELVLEKILDGLADVIEYQTKNQTTNSRRTVERGVNKSGELSDFYAYLIESGKTHTTADNYRKAVMQAINAMEYSGVEELNAKVDEAIYYYVEDGRDLKYHNLHTAALRRYKDFLNNK